MELSNSMVRAAVNKAVEAGLLARNAAQNAYDWEIMRAILMAALGAQPACEQPADLESLHKIEFW